MGKESVLITFRRAERRRILEFDGRRLINKVLVVVVLGLLLVLLLLRMRVEEVGMSLLVNELLVMLMMLVLVLLLLLGLGRSLGLLFRPESGIVILMDPTGTFSLIEEI